MFLPSCSLIAENRVGAIGVIIFKTVCIVAVNIKNMVAQCGANMHFWSENKFVHRAAGVAHISGPWLYERSSVKSMQIGIRLVDTVGIYFYVRHICLLVLPTIGIGLIPVGIGAGCAGSIVHLCSCMHAAANQQQEGQNSAYVKL